MKRSFPCSIGTMGILLLCFLAVTTMLLGCVASDKIRSGPSSKNPIQTLLVVPFKNQNTLRGVNATYICSLCGRAFTTDTVENGAEGFVTETIVKILGKKMTVTLIPNDRIDVGREELLLDNESKPEYLELLMGIGRELGADAVLTGSVYKFRQRVGSDFSADFPAAVGVDLDLIDTKTAQLIWHTRFDESQEYLSDNLLKLGSFIERGGKWATAEELTEYGLTDILERSPIP